MIFPGSAGALPKVAVSITERFDVPEGCPDLDQSGPFKIITRRSCGLAAGPAVILVANVRGNLLDVG